MILGRQNHSCKKQKEKDIKEVNKISYKGLMFECANIIDSL